MSTTKDEYNPYSVLVNTWATYSPENMNLIEIFIEIKGTKNEKNEWFRLRNVDGKPKMRRGPRHATRGRQQQGPELKNEKDNLGKVEVEKDAKPFAHFHDYDSFRKKISDQDE
jgi:hypothetical protein